MRQKKVCADTITKTTAAAGFHDGEATSFVPPARDDLIDAIRAAFTTRAEHDKFDKILNSVPDGFELTPVLYSRISQRENLKVESEYYFNVRPRFLQYLAAEHADELSALGICDQGIDRMRQGLDPVDEQGRYYEISIDHIVERSGSGQWGREKEADDLQPGFASPKFKVNHFDNFVLLPDHIHQYKNDLNVLQKPTQIAPGDSQWILMMTPVADATHSGFVRRPQNPQSPHHGLRRRAETMDSRLSRLKFANENMLRALEKFQDMPEVGAILTNCYDLARKRGRKVMDAVNDNSAAVNNNTADLSAHFRRALAAQGPAYPEIHDRLNPLMAESQKCLSEAFEAASKDVTHPKGRAHFDNFARFYRSGTVRAIRHRVAQLPTKEARAFHDLCAKIDRDMLALENTIGGQARDINRQNRRRRP